MAQSDLIPVTERTKEEAKRISRAGGIASGKARRKLKEMREWAKIIGALPAKVVCPDGKELKGATLDADLVMQQFRKAHNGSTSAAYFLATLRGQLEEKVSLSSEKPIIVVRNDEERDKLAKMAKLEG